MAELVLHPATARQLESFVSSPGHAVVLIGPTGSGKRSLAYKTASHILGSDFENYAYKLIISSQNGTSIGIEAVRELEQFLSLKVPGQRAINRIIIIEDAHQLTTEAQNALLKTLEEPPKGSLLLLTASHEQALLPTIRSRVSAINVTRPDKPALRNAFSEADERQFNQAYAISGGLPGLLHALISETEHPLLQATETARALLQQNSYERLLRVDELSKQRQLALDVTFIMQQMAHVSLQSATEKTAQRWRNILEKSYAASEALSTSAQPKLVLTNLMLNL
jgi:replication-associated recombination protein RarA